MFSGNAALSRQVIEETFLEYREQFDSLVLGTWQRINAGSEMLA